MHQKFAGNFLVPSPNHCGFSELRLRREQFIDLLKSAASDMEMVESEFTQYLRLLYGFVFEVEDPNKDSKLRYLGKFVWTNSLIGADGL